MSNRSNVLPRGFTVSEVAARFRVGKATVRAWIVEGRLRAENTSTNGTPRYVVGLDAIEEFRQTITAAPARPKRRRAAVKDYLTE